MASAYALPSSALPHAHRQHMNGHSHAHSPPSLNAIKSSMSTSAIHGHNSSIGHSHAHEGHGHGHDHDAHDPYAASRPVAHSHAHSYSNSGSYKYGHKPSHSHSSSLSSSVPQSKVVSRNSSSTALQSRERPSSLVLPDSWKAELETDAPELNGDANKNGLPNFNVDNDRHQSHSHDHDHGGCSGHSHSHSHSHDHNDHSHSHSHSHDHAHDNDHKHSHDQAHMGNGHAHSHSDHHHGQSQPSLFSRLLLRYSERLPFLHTILVEKDSRRIFYFLTLNFTFMGVQGFYAYATSSLGLLSDTVHMFFDCFALLVGLCAAVMSKWPPSDRYPYGLGKVETLSGFANGILLILLSIEIIGEAAERMVEGTPPKRLTELLTISVLGGLVNAVGLLGFGHHHHHGHDHGHSHGGCSSSNKKDDDHHHGHGHGHDHHNENMEGIFLHVMADLMGSVAVVISTLLTMYTGWTWWDAVAGMAVSVLIAMAAWPLLKSSARNLLLSIPETTEYNLRNTLAGIVQQRGVVGYGVPKFWIDDIQSSSGGREKLKGIVHVVAARGVGLEDVRDRVREYLMRNDMDIMVQVEREGDGACWCGVGRLASPGLMSPKAL